MFPRSLFQSSFPVFSRRRDRGGIEKLKRAVPAGRHAGEKGCSENSAATAQKAPRLLHLHAESHKAWGRSPSPQRFHMCSPAGSCEKLTIGLEGKRPLQFTLPELDVQFVQCQEMSGLAVRGWKTPLLPGRVRPPLLLDDTGALFKFCRFMEVEGNVLCKIRGLKALVLVSRKQQWEGGKGQVNVPATCSTRGLAIFLIDLAWCLLSQGGGGRDRIKDLKRSSSGCNMT